jgi:hypothetical protein
MMNIDYTKKASSLDEAFLIYILLFILHLLQPQAGWLRLTHLECVGGIRAEGVGRSKKLPHIHTAISKAAVGIGAAVIVMDMKM